MLGFTQIGSGISALAIGLVLFLTGDRLAAYEIILGTLTLWIVVELVKALVRRSRPFIRVTQARIVGYRAGGRSFPSGHTSQAFFMATLLARHFHASALGSVSALRYRLIGGHHAHVCGGALSARRAGGGYPGQRLGTPGGACRWVCAERDRVKRLKACPICGNLRKIVRNLIDLNKDIDSPYRIR